MKPEGHWSRGPLGPELTRLHKALMDVRWSGEQLTLFDLGHTTKAFDSAAPPSRTGKEPLTCVKNKDQTRAREGVRPAPTSE